ncbi:MAG: C4-type zinc ribbon domain-containing protein [Bacteroidota bacterium]
MAKIVDDNEKVKTGKILKTKSKVAGVEITDEFIQSEDFSKELEVSIEKKLLALYTLQQIDSQINKIRIIRGELPLEVQDLEDEIAGLQTRIDNYVQEIKSLEDSIVEKHSAITESKDLIARYTDQQRNVKNNREFDSLTKEVEFQNLEIELCEKRIKEYSASLTEKKSEVEQAQINLNERQGDLDLKKAELDDIIAETKKEEQELMTKSHENQKFIEDRLLTAYHRIRKNARNGLAVVLVERDACGGCFNKIPPQRQLDIRMHKKIIVCEYCGRILVDSGIDDVVNN